jgi:hypothetical protein
MASAFLLIRPPTLNFTALAPVSASRFTKLAASCFGVVSRVVLEM